MKKLYDRAYLDWISYHTCTQCGKKMEVDNFYRSRNSKKGFVAPCKKCVLKRHKDNQGTSEERGRVNKWRKSAKGLVSCYRADVKKAYGVSLERLRGMMDSQLGCCNICGESLIVPESPKAYSIDHNHKTGEVRGLLCNQCNLGLGQFKDNPYLLIKAAEYLSEVGYYG